jgi:2-polyprenyl-3-methyl-5-hydroxy-6-metoxy-1,4-benzoquinol methylase
MLAALPDTAPAEGLQLCRLCRAPLRHVFVDLGVSPIANAYLTEEQLRDGETFYPLRVYVCSECLLVQVQDARTREQIFADDYAYFSSYSSSWLEHCERYAETVVSRFGLQPGQRVVEIASNDGYLLQFFHRRGLEVLGIEPAASVAEAAAIKGVPTVRRFFGRELATELRGSLRADLLIGNNVLAHVPDLVDFVSGLKLLLADTGVLTMEFPHLLQLVAEAQFDTIYHEHFSYISFLVARELFARHGLVLFDVEELPTHGGSLRVYVRHAENDRLPETSRVRELEERERNAGYGDLGIYLTFADRVKQLKYDALRVLLDAKAGGRSIVGYGAPAKGNTFLNYCGIGPEFLDYTVDISPHKQGMFLPGTRIPIYSPDVLSETRPDFVLILPWNIRNEVMQQIAYVRDWGGQFIVRTPEFAILP